ncbi:bifunctional DNA primase/polymerase [Paracoccus denitrificans]|uniref:bifunctional DNA primase/polymerase n=1 Tax=Paracoccus denitrificans TaxID=266 RepID=UPI003364F31B
MGIYSQHAPIYADAGLPVFPVDARNKRPAVKGWQNATPRRARGWATKPDLANMDGLGIVMGKPSGITEVDVDAVGGAWITAARERFGDTSIIIRTASGKAKLWYRHNGEGRHIRPFHGLPIDILGGGFTIAPPSWRDDLGSSYSFVSGSLDDLNKLRPIRSDAMPGTFTRAPEAVQRGERNDSLWRYCMAQARHCDDVEALIDVAATWNSAFPDPLGSVEVEACARSAWQYESEGRNYLGLRKPQLTAKDKRMDDLLHEHPEAYALYDYLHRWHHSRPFFAIAPRAMSEAGSPAWPRRKIERARDVLLEKGYVVEIVPPRRGVSAGQYRFSDQMPISAHNHNTFPPPALVEVAGHA